MRLTRYMAEGGPRWAVDGHDLPADLTLSTLLGLPSSALKETLGAAKGELVPDLEAISPIEADQEVWASGVTYLRSRMEREAESTVADVYAKVYEADRPEIFFKSQGWRVVPSGGQIRIRRDSDWNVPEPELTLVVNSAGEIVGYTAGNDVSSRAIEGENPLYLPQAKTYDGSCALGPDIVLADAASLTETEIKLTISRNGEEVFQGETAINQMKRKLPDLVGYLVRETSFPSGAFLMTGTGIVPAYPFTMVAGDVVRITVGEVTLENAVAAN